MELMLLLMAEDEVALTRVSGHLLLLLLLMLHCIVGGKLMTHGWNTVHLIAGGRGRVVGDAVDVTTAAADAGVSGSRVEKVKVIGKVGRGEEGGG